jgi:hypothetical protein
VTTVRFRDTTAATGKEVNISTKVVIDKMFTLLKFCGPFIMGLQEHDLLYSYLMTVLSFVSIPIYHHYNDQQDGKVIPLLVRLQTCLVLYNFLSAIYFFAAFEMYYCDNVGVTELFVHNQ